MFHPRPSPCAAPERFWRCLSLILAMALLPLSVAAQGFGRAPARGGFPAEVQARFYPSAAQAGSTVRLDVELKLKPGHYTYAMDLPRGGPRATTPRMAEKPEFLALPEGAKWTAPPAKVKFDEAFQMEVGVYEKGVTFSHPVVLAPDAPEGPAKLSGTLEIQVCDSSSCLPPRRVPFTAEILIRSGDEASTATEALATATPAPTPEPTAAPTKTPTAGTEEVKDGAPTAPLAPTPNTPPPSSNAGATGGTVGDGSSEPTTPWAFFVLAFVAGLATLATPCVFPMIPITIGFFAKRASHTTGQRVMLTATYGLAILFGFTVIGFAFALGKLALGWGAGHGGIVNQIAADWRLNLALAALFLAFALSLFGVFEIRLPSSWANRLQGASAGRTDAVGAVLMALVFVIVSFTCTAPFLGALIPQVLSGAWTRPVLGFAFYGLGFALPFFLLGLVPGAVASLPKAGGWMNETKVVMGLLELGLAFLYLSKADLVLDWNIFTREALLAVWVVVMALAAFYLLGKIRLAHDTDVHRVGVPRLLFSVLCASLALYLTYGLFGGRVWPDVEALLPPRKTVGAAPMMAVAPPLGTVGGESAVAGLHLNEIGFIENDLEAALALGREHSKPVFVDFTGWTCSNCRLMEQTMFPRPEVQARLKDMITVSLYTDDREVGEKFQDYQLEKTGQLTLPTYAIMTPDEEVLAHFGGMTRNEADFVEFLDAGLSQGRVVASAGR